MTDAISDLIDWGANQLSLAGVENPRNEAEGLLRSGTRFGFFGSPSADSDSFWLAV